ncbi:MAG: hypothetical protein NWQ38_01950 [Cellulophaga sp.]|nr:hypothetical protein [Cellulophaga sp.]
MDFTRRQMVIIAIVNVQENANLSTIRVSLFERISIPTLNSEINKLINQNVLYQSGIGRGKTKADA